MKKNEREFSRAKLRPFEQKARIGKRKSEVKRAGKPRGAMGRLNSLYQRIPVLPFFDRPSSALLLLCIAAFALFTVFVFLTTPPFSLQGEVRGAPLSKNTNLQLLPGERYSYEISSPNGKQLLYYSVSSSPACNGTLVTESDGQASRGLCLASNGNPANESISQENYSSSNGSMLLFSPWMLAVSENFSWQVDTVFSAGTAQVTFPTYFSSQGKKTVAGRDAFAIGIWGGIPIGNESTVSTFYVDSQKRVLLLANLSNVSIKLVQAPFELDWNSSNSTN